MNTPSLDDIYRRCYLEDECLIWKGAVDGRGYGNIGRSKGGKRRNWIVHRLVYEHVYGLPPLGLDVHHTCGNRLCVNPEHLEAITRAEHHGKKGRHPDHMRPALRSIGKDLRPE